MIDLQTAKTTLKAVWALVHKASSQPLSSEERAELRDHLSNLESGTAHYGLNHQLADICSFIHASDIAEAAVTLVAPHTTLGFIDTALATVACLC